MSLRQWMERMGDKMTPPVSITWKGITYVAGTPEYEKFIDRYKYKTCDEYGKDHGWHQSQDEMFCLTCGVMKKVK